MRQLLNAAVAACILVGPCCFANNETLKTVNQLELQGQFKQAAAAITTALQSKSLPAPDRQKLDFELDRLDRIKKDFPFTKQELFDELKKAVKGLTADEYDQWVKEGRFDSREIDGQRYFMGSSESNLFFRYPELNPRRMPSKDTTAHQKAVLENCLAIKQ